MTTEDQIELDTLKQDLRQTQLLLKQEEGKRIAVERDSYEVKRAAKLAHEQAEALVGETQASLQQAAQDMKVALCVSQGVFGLGKLCRAFVARKVASARVVHREQQVCLLMQQAIDALAKNDKTALQVSVDKMKAVIATVKQDGENVRMAAVQAMLNYGIAEFETVFDNLVRDQNGPVQA